MERALQTAQHQSTTRDDLLEQAELFYLDAVNNHLKQNLGFSEKEIEHTLIPALKNYCASLIENGDLNIKTAISLSEHYHIAALKKLIAPLDRKKIVAVGYHGQTVLHQPPVEKNKNGITLQIGDPQKIAHALQLPVVGDFRKNDMLNGGQGAPLAPLHHLLLNALDSQFKPCIVVNCGGIANISWLDTEHIFSFDTGPGVRLLDDFVIKKTKGEQRCDQDGLHAKNGKINKKLLSALFEKAIQQNGKNYFDLPPPKSLDSQDILFIDELNDPQLSLADGCRTLAAFTAESIVRETEKFLGVLKKEWLSEWTLCGGGWNHPVIYNEFKKRLSDKIPQLHLLKEQERGLAQIEPGIFAHAALYHYLEIPFTFPSTTGVRTPMVAGKLYTHSN